MANGPGFNITTSASPMAGPTAAPGGMPNATPTTTKAVQRAIAPPTAYNPESGVVEPAGSWGAGRDGATEAPAETPPAEPASPDRRLAWLQAQEAKRAEKVAAKQERATKAQALARGMLEKGDIVGASKALGMTPEELMRSVNAGYMGMPPKPAKEMTADEKRDAELKAYREELDAEKTARVRLESSIARQNYIATAIAPVIKDADAYEFIHAQGLDQIQAYIYDYCNQHFQKTGEELPVKDVADAIEQQLFESSQAGYRTFAKTKKGRGVLGARAEDSGGEERADEAAEETPRGRESVFAEPRIEHRPTAPVASRSPLKLETESGASPVVQAIRRPAQAASVPFALLSPAERHRLLEEERRAGGG